MVVVVVVVTDTRYYHNCESEHSHDQPCPVSATGESGAMLSTQLQGSHHQVCLSQHQVSFVTMQSCHHKIGSPEMTTIKYILPSYPMIYNTAYNAIMEAMCANIPASWYIILRGIPSCCEGILLGRILSPVHCCG